jgi:hypothetical protein
MLLRAAGPAGLKALGITILTYHGKREAYLKIVFSFLLCYER